MEAYARASVTVDQKIDSTQTFTDVGGRLRVTRHRSGTTKGHRDAITSADCSEPSLTSLCGSAPSPDLPPLLNVRGR